MVLPVGDDENKTSIFVCFKTAFLTTSKCFFNEFKLLIFT